ncbi:unnamed protein product [Symbiodinium sp. CCMP2456]|nr:unnamed protein product [Symbiodinium sp. CCMP2456]
MMSKMMETTSPRPGASLAFVMQLFRCVAAFVEAYPAALSAAVQVVICIVLYVASCIFRRDSQPTVNVHIGGVTVSVAPSAPQTAPQLYRKDRLVQVTAVLRVSMPKRGSLKQPVRLACKVSSRTQRCFQQDQKQPTK